MSESEDQPKNLQSPPVTQAPGAAGSVYQSPGPDPSDVAPDADEPGDETVPEELEELATDKPELPDEVDQKEVQDER